MKALKFLYLLVGVAMLAAVLWQVDLQAVLREALQVGWAGLVVVLGLYLTAFVIDSFTWQLALTGLPVSALWAYRTFKVRMVGEFFNNVMPAASMGGEPVKAALLKRHYGIGYRESTASLVIAKTINMVSLMIFLVVGFALMLHGQVLASVYNWVAGAGLIGLGVGTFLFFVVQRWRISSWVGSRLSAYSWGKRVADVLHLIEDMDERLVTFYTRHRARFVWAVGLAFANWLLGAVEVYYVLTLLGNPVSIWDAWVIEAVAQLIRAGMFFIPASIGVQEGGFLLVCGAITGSPTVGLAVAVVRRLREVLWLLWGAAIGGLFSIRRPNEPQV